MQTKHSLDYSATDELFNIEVMKNYNNSIVNSAIDNLSNPKNIQNVIDFGAGIGTLSALFRKKSFQPICVEVDQKNCEILKKRGFNTVSSLDQIDEDISFIFSSNVLEHINNDVEILNQMREKLSDDGNLFLYLPAHRLLWSQLDEAVGHYRRYSFKDLAQKLQQADFEIKKMHYADSIGFLATIAIKIFGFNSNKSLGSKSSLEFYDRYIFPVSKFLDYIGLNKIIGKNIILVAQPKKH